MRDVCLIGAVQRVEPYEIAAYGTARAMADLTKHTEVARLLNQTIQEEGAADKKQTKIAACAGCVVSGHLRKSAATLAAGV